MATIKVPAIARIILSIHMLTPVDKYDWFLMNAPLPRVKEKLAAKCPGGVVSGVQSHLVTRDWYIVKEYELLAEASCQSLGSAKL